MGVLKYVWEAGWHGMAYGMKISGGQVELGVDMDSIVGMCKCVVVRRGSVWQGV